MARRRNKNYSEPLDLGPSRHARGKRKRRRVLLVLLLALVGLAAALPTIVANTPLRDEVLARALPAGAGKVTMQSARLGWTGGQTLRNVRWLDAEGNPLFEAESISLDRSLTSLITNRRDLGTIRIVRPAINLVTTPTGSNWEAALARFRKQQDDEPDTPTEVTIEPQPVAVNLKLEITEGGLAARDATTGQQWNLHGLNLTAATDARAGTWVADGVANVQMVSPDAALASRPGKIEVHVKSPAPGRQELRLVSQQLPLEPLEPWLARVAPNTRITGDAASDISVNWQLPPADDPAAQAALEAHGRIDLSNAKFTSAALSGDILQLDQATLDTKLLAEGELIAVEQLQVVSDWFNGNVSGAFNVNELRQLGLDRMPSEPASVSGSINLVSLTKQLPRTLQMRPGVKVDSGTVQMTARSLAGAEGQSWDIDAEVRDLHGTDGQREIRWDQPVKAYAELVATPQQAARLNTVTFRSPFASAKLDAVAEGADGNFRFDLQKLANQLGQFVDLSAWQLRGTGSGKLTVRETGEQGFLATLLADLEQVDVRHEGKPVWEDDRLHLDVQLSGQTSGQHENYELRQLASATLTMQGVSDIFTVELLKPLDLRPADNAGLSFTELHLKGRGPLTRWAGRARPWVAGIPEKINGATTLDARLVVADGLLSMSDVNLEVEDLRGTWGEVQFDEPLAKLVGDLRWQAVGRSLDSRTLAFTSSTVAFRSRNLAVQLSPDTPPIAQGEIAYTADLERLASLAGITAGNSTWPRGIAEGKITLDSGADEAAAEVTCTAKNLDIVTVEQAAGAAYGKPRVLWNEPKLELSGRVAYQQAVDRLRLGDLKIVGQTVQASGTAVVEEATATQRAQGDFTLAYDAAALDKLIAEKLGPGAKLQGANQSRVQFAGTMNPAGNPTGDGQPVDWSRRWNVVASTGWQAADMYGLPFGAALLEANLRDGQLLFKPVDLQVGQGRFTAQPQVTLDPPPRVLQMPKGPVITRVAVSEKVSDSLLKYAAPFLAGAARAEGEFSLDLDGARIPLDAPKQSDLGGRLTIHRLAVLPGETTKPMIDLLRQINLLARGREIPADGNVPAGNGITMQEQPIDIRVVEGRVYHREMQFLVDDVPVKSTGWVSFDEQLHLDLEVPVQEKWVRGSKYFRSLAGKKLRIPVRGTLTSWKIDDRVITDLIQNAAGAVIGDEINRQLEKLLRGR